jgi:hypothetical protein
MSDQQTNYNTPSLIGTVLTSGLLPLVPALLPLATTAVTKRQPYEFSMFWASPASLLFLVFLGAVLGVITFWMRSASRISARPSALLRIGCGLAGWALGPIPAIFRPDAPEAYAMLFLAPSLAMAGVAFAWRLRQWPATVRHPVTLAIAIVVTEWVVGTLRYAPPGLPLLSQLAIPVAIIALIVKTWAIVRPE